MYILIVQNSGNGVKSVRVYFKEFFGHSSTLVVAGLAVLCLLAAMPEIGTWQVWVSMVVGAILFFAMEYVTHRFFFHMKAPKNQTLLKFMRRIHYGHHDLPNDLDLLFLPVWYSVPNNAVALGLAYLITGSWTLSLALTCGALVAMLVYEWTHFVAHRPIRPLTAWGRWMKKLHLLHHYKNENYWFGVTNPTMDVVMGTWRNEKEVELSPTARKLLGK